MKDVKDKEKKVERSRLTLLGALAAASAGGGCGTVSSSRNKGYQTFGKQSYPSENSGGGDGDGGGGSH